MGKFPANNCVVGVGIEGMLLPVSVFACVVGWGNLKHVRLSLTPHPEKKGKKAKKKIKKRGNIK